MNQPTNCWEFYVHETGPNPLYICAIAHNHAPDVSIRKMFQPWRTGHKNIGTFMSERCFSKAHKNPEAAERDAMKHFGYVRWNRKPIIRVKSPASMLR